MGEINITRGGHPVRFPVSVGNRPDSATGPAWEPAVTVGKELLPVFGCAIGAHGNVLFAFPQDRESERRRGGDCGSSQRRMAAAGGRERWDALDLAAHASFILLTLSLKLIRLGAWSERLAAR